MAVDAKPFAALADVIATRIKGKTGPGILLGVAVVLATK